METRREHLTKTAELQAIAEAKSEKWWHRAPFIYTVMIALIGLIFASGAWTATINSRVDKIEALSSTYEREQFPETIRNVKNYTEKLKNDRGIGILEEVHTQRRQIRKLNNLPDDE